MPLELGGTDDRSNAVPSCATCNRIKRAHQFTPVPTIAILGAAATGKTTLALRLQLHTGWPYLAIDCYRQRDQTWDHLIADLERLTAEQLPAITESMALPHRYRRTLILRRALLVTVTVPETVRQDRLRDRPPDFPRDQRWDDTRICHAAIDGTADHPTTQLAKLQADAVARAAIIVGVSSRNAGNARGPARLA